jgi:hypothetical protein
MIAIEVQQDTLDDGCNIVSAEPACPETAIELLFNKLSYFLAATELLRNMSRQVISQPKRYELNRFG